MVEDLLLNVPRNITEQAVEIMAGQREIFSRFFYWVAHSLHRRDPADLGNIEKKAGMLIQIKLLLSLLGSAPRGVEAHPVVGRTIPIEKDYKDDIENFKKYKVIKK